MLLLATVLLATPAAALTPDLVVTSVSGPAGAELGSQITLQATLRNAGDAPVGQELKYTWFISADRAVTISDVVLGTAMTPDLPAGQAVMVSSGPLTLPPGLVVGASFIGVCVNFDPQASPRFGANEATLVNNCATSLAPLVLSSGQLAVTTQAMLPAATQFAPWGVQLQAAGGNGTYAWSLASGSMSLPVGIRLEQGMLVGSPSVAGTFTFTLQVTSGTASATAGLSLVISPGDIPLTLANQSLPSAEYGRVYDVPLLATGGKPPYHWAGTHLPEGLNVSGDGWITGVPQATGVFPFEVNLTDSAGGMQSGALSLRVVVPSGLHIGVTRLETAFLQRDYVQPLVAVGGKAPYTWSVTRFQQLPEDVTQKPGDLLDALPEDFGLRLDNGALRGVAKHAGLYSLELKLSDSNGANDTTRLLFKVSYTEPIQLTTAQLPGAYIGTGYAAQLSHNRLESTGVRFRLTCVQVPVDLSTFECQAGTAMENKLPAGLTMSEDGLLSGSPLSQPTGSYVFLVEVIDDAGRRDLRSLSIRLQPFEAPPGGGCSGTAAAPSLLWSLLALAGIRRKKAAP